MSVSPHPPTSGTTTSDQPTSGTTTSDQASDLEEVTVTDEVVRGLVDAAPDGLVMVDGNGAIQLVNRRAEQIFGYARGELVGRPIEDLVPEPARQVHRAHRTRYRAAPTVRAMGEGDLLRGRRKDSSEFPVEISLSPLATADGQRIIATVRDVTVRIAAEAHNAVIRHAIDRAADGIFVCDERTLEFTYVNSSAAHMYGYTIPELVGMTPLHLAPDLATSDLERLMKPLVDEEVNSIGINTTGLRKDGSDFPVELNMNHPPASGPDAPRPLVAIVRDVSERVEAADRIARAEQRASVLADRERLARDLHDTIIQELFALGLGINSTILHLDDDAVAERLHANVDAIDAIIRSIRTTIFGLTSHRDWGEGLRGKLLEMAAGARSSLGFEPVVIFTGELDALPEPIAEELVPTLSEALSNVAKHAAATKVTVDVTVSGGSVTMTIQDDGVGLPAGARDTGGFGLENMARRAEMIGGLCVVDAPESGGTAVRWQAPLRD